MKVLFLALSSPTSNICVPIWQENGKLLFPVLPTLVNSLTIQTRQDSATLPNKSFSGLELMCFMYAGFKMFAPDHDVNPELDEPYAIALSLFHEGRLG
ncbi:MAG: hypothetical protein WCJ40_20040 [Planctomycetota bacterium]